MKTSHLETDTKTVNMTALHDLLQSVEGMKVDGPGGLLASTYQVTMDDNNVWVTYPDEVDSADVDAVLSSPNLQTPVAVSDLDQYRSDLIAQYQAAITRLDAIVTNGPTYTAVQTRDAVVDMAKIQRALLKLVRREMT